MLISNNNFAACRDSTQTNKRSLIDTIIETPGSSIGMSNEVSQDMNPNSNLFSQRTGDNIVSKIDDQIKKVMGEVVLSDFEKLDQD